VTTKAQLAIIGLPGTGKTTLADALGAALELPVLHTDDFAGLKWAVQADAAMEAIPARGIVEGVTVARLFRRGFLPECVVYLAGGGRLASPQLLALMNNGLLDYDLALVRGHCGRVLHVPELASADTVLWLMGTLGPEDG
jgi:hypothetical protein